MAELFLDKNSSFSPCFAYGFFDYEIVSVDCIEGDGAEFFWVRFSIGEDGFVGEDVFYGTYDMEIFSFGDEFFHFALEGEGIFFDDRCIDECTLYGVEAGFFDFSFHFVRADRAEVVGFRHSFYGSHGNSEGSCFSDIVHGFVMMVQHDSDFVRIVNAGLGSHHGIRFSFFVISPDDDTGLGVNPGLGLE